MVRRTRGRPALCAPGSDLSWATPGRVRDTSSACRSMGCRCYCHVVVTSSPSTMSPQHETPAAEDQSLALVVKRSAQDAALDSEKYAGHRSLPICPPEH